MVITTYASVPGDYAQQAEVGQLNKSAVAIARGDLLYLDTTDNNFKPVTTGITTAPRFAVAALAALSTDTKVLAVTKGPVFIAGQGVINPGRKVIVSASTAKAVAEGAASPAVNVTVGAYIGKASNNERDGLSLAASADGDAVLIDLNGGLSY
jgi:hypothetical protein